MRIIGGQLKGSNLISPDGINLRPTTDRVKESIFNILLHGINDFNMENIEVMDIFCGTGALGLEAISRGARHSVFIDFDSDAIKIARQNAWSMGLDDKITMLKLDAQYLAKPPKVVKSPASLVFLDPPYNKGLVYSTLLGLKSKGWLKQKALCVVEVAAREIPDFPKEFYILNERIYGLTRIFFLRYNGVKN
jgi:16S rRNA (guanine966-N2)-methyltransferase